MMQTSTSIELGNKTFFNVVRLKKQNLFNDAHVGDSRGEKGEEKLGIRASCKHHYYFFDLSHTFFLCKIEF